MSSLRQETTQVLAGKYLRKERLTVLLDSLFGHQQWELQMIDESWYLQSPRPLTEDEIQSCMDNRNLLRDQDPEESVDSLSQSRRPDSTTADPSPKVSRQVYSMFHLETLSRSTTPSSDYEVSSEPFLPPKHTAYLVKTYPREMPPQEGDIELIIRETTGVNYFLRIESWRMNMYDNCISKYRVNETSTVFKVDAEVTPSTAGRTWPTFLTELAVKGIYNTKRRDDDKEYMALDATSSVRHRNIVTFIGCLYCGGEDRIRYILLFPMAIGNLEQLFTESIDHGSLLQNTNSLWAQFEGLASALECLHVQLHTTHGNITPSNILLYQRADDLGMVAKLAGFSLATKYPEWADKYGRQFQYEDVSKLGTIFAELLTYLSGGVEGIKRFRSFLTVAYDQRIPDAFADIQYDENGVKPEVTEWLKRASGDHFKGKEVAEITARMLGSRYECPSAAEVANYLADSISASFFDGRRFVHFRKTESTPGPSVVDKARLFIEGRVGAPIQWWPFSPVKYPCHTGSMRIEWKWCAHNLYVDLPTEVVKEYKEKFCTIASSLPQGPLLPLSKSQKSPTFPGNIQPTGLNVPIQRGTTNSGPQSSGESSIAITAASGSGSSPQVKVSELYWCVDKAWVEPSETWLCTENPLQIIEDRILCLRLKNSYDRIRGFRGRYLSWKTCLGIKFTSFNRLYDSKDQVICMFEGLPNPPEYEYVLTKPKIVHMAMASVQIVAGMHDPSKVEGNSTLEMIPKKVDALLEPDKGAEGWGLHAVQGWSMWKIVFWFGALGMVGMLFMVLWLVLVDPKDLQNAFTPVMALMTILGLAVAIPQYLDAA